MELQKYTATFENKAITAYPWNNRPVFVATEVGEAAGYSEGRRLVDSITGRWADEFIEGTDYIKLEGGQLRDFAEQTASANLADAKTRHLVLLTETGVHMALIKGKTPLCKKLRRFLAEEVLPKLVRGEALVHQKTELELAADVQIRVLEKEQETVRTKALLLAVEFVQRRVSQGSMSQEHGDVALTSLFEQLTPVKFVGGRKLIQPDRMSCTTLGKRHNMSAHMVGQIMTWIESKFRIDLRTDPQYCVREIVAAANQPEGSPRDVEGFKVNSEGEAVFERYLPEFIKAHPASVAATPKARRPKNAIRKSIEQAAQQSSVKVGFGESLPIPAASN